MLTDLSIWRAMSRPRFYGYLAMVGGLAGLFSWLLVFGGALVFDMPRPTGVALFWAIPRGALFAMILGMVLRWVWRRRRTR